MTIPGISTQVKLGCLHGIPTTGANVFFLMKDTDSSESTKTQM